MHKTLLVTRNERILWLNLWFFFGVLILILSAQAVKHNVIVFFFGIVVHNMETRTLLDGKHVTVEKNANS